MPELSTIYDTMAPTQDSGERFCQQYPHFTSRIRSPRSAALTTTLSSTALADHGLPTLAAGATGWLLPTAHGNPYSLEHSRPQHGNPFTALAMVTALW